MNEAHLPDAIVALADQLVTLPGVVAVTLKDATHGDVALDDGRWSLGLYHDDSFVPATLPGVEGIESVAGELASDGSLAVAYRGSLVDIHVRDYNAVRHWMHEAEHGRFEVHEVPEHLAGKPTYSLVAELALDRVLAGSIDGVLPYSGHLASSGASHWRKHAAASLDQAASRAGRGDTAGVHGHLVRAAYEAAHARLCEARKWTKNEKEILEQAELTHMYQILATLNTDPATLVQRVMQARALLLD